MDKTILKHILIRIGFIMGTPILLIYLMLSEADGNSDAAGNGMARRLAGFYAMGISLITIVLGLLIDIFYITLQRGKKEIQSKSCFTDISFNLGYSIYIFYIFT